MLTQSTSGSSASITLASPITAACAGFGAVFCALPLHSCAPRVTMHNRGHLSVLLRHTCEITCIIRKVPEIALLSASPFTTLSLPVPSSASLLGCLSSNGHRSTTASASSMSLCSLFMSPALFGSMMMMLEVPGIATVSSSSSSVAAVICCKNTTPTHSRSLVTCTNAEASFRDSLSRPHRTTTFVAFRPPEPVISIALFGATTFSQSIRYSRLSITCCSDRFVLVPSPRSCRSNVSPSMINNASPVVLCTSKSTFRILSSALQFFPLAICALHHTSVALAMFAMHIRSRSTPTGRNDIIWIALSSSPFPLQRIAEIVWKHASKSAGCSPQNSFAILDSSFFRTAWPTAHPSPLHNS